MDFNPIETANNQVPLEQMQSQIRQSVSPNENNSGLKNILDSVYTGEENLFGGTGIQNQRQKLSMEDNVSIGETHALVGDEWLAKYPSYKIGRDNAEYAAQNQSGLEQAFNGWTKGVNNIGTVIAGNTVGFVYGLQEFAGTGNFNSVFDNSFSRTLDEWNTKLNYQLPNYYTKQAQESGFWGQLAENPSNTIFNDVFNGLSFTIGTIASEAIWAYATGGSSLALRGGQLGARLANAGKWGKMFLGAEKTAEGLKAYKGFMGEALKNAVRTGQISTGTAKALAKTGNVINTTRFIATSSGNEAGIEAFHFKKEAEENFYHNFEQMYGRPPSDEEISTFKGDVEDAANGVFAANMAILGVSNLAMLGNLFGIKSPISALQKQINKKVFGVGVTKGASGWEAVAPTKWQKASRALYIPVASITREGLFEEAGQGTATKTANLWIERKYDPKYIDKTIDLMELAGKATQEQYGTKEGWKDIWIGGIVGLLGASFTGEISRFKQEQKNIEENVVKSMNANEALKTTLVSDITSGRISAVATQLEAQDRAERKMLEGDVVQAKLAQYDGLLAGFMMSDTYDDSANLVDDLSMAIDVSEDISLEEKEAFKTSLKELHETYKKATSFAEAIVGGQGRIYGTDKSAQLAKEALTFVLVQGQNANKLMQESFEEIRAYVSEDHASAIKQSETLSELGTEARRNLKNTSQRYRYLDKKAEEARKKVRELQAAPKEIEGDRESRITKMQNRLIEIEEQKKEIREEIDSLSKQLEQTNKLKASLSETEQSQLDYVGEFISTDDLLNLDERLDRLEESYKSMERLSPTNAKMVSEAMNRYQNAKKALLDYNSASAVIARGEFKPKLANDNIFSKILGKKRGTEKEDTYTLEFFDAILANRMAKGADMAGMVQQADAEKMEARKKELEDKETLTEEEAKELEQINETLSVLNTQTTVKDDRPSKEKRTEKKIEELKEQIQNLKEELDSTPETITSEESAIVNASELKVGDTFRYLDNNGDIKVYTVKEVVDNIGSVEEIITEEGVTIKNPYSFTTTPKDAWEINKVSAPQSSIKAKKSEQLKNTSLIVNKLNIRNNDKTVRQAINDANKNKITIEELDDAFKKWDDENGLTELLEKADELKAELKALEEQTPQIEEQPNPRYKELKNEIAKLERELNRLQPTQITPTDTVEVLKQRINNILDMFKSEFVGMDNIEEKIKNKPDQKDIERYRALLAEGVETDEFLALKDKLSKWRVYDSLMENENESIADLLDLVSVLEKEVEEIETITEPTPEYDSNADLDTNKSDKVDNFNLTQNTNFPPTIKVKKDGTIVITHIKVPTILTRFQAVDDVQVNGKEFGVDPLKIGDIITFEDNGIKRTLKIGVGMSIEMAKEDFLAIPNFITSNVTTSNITNWTYSILYEKNENGEVIPLKSDFHDDLITGHTNDLKEGDTVELYVDVNHPYNKQLLEEGDKTKIANEVVVLVRKNGENYQTLKSLQGRVKNDAIIAIRKEAVKKLKSGSSGQIGTTTVERVELGIPILTLTENGAITSRPITEKGVEKIEAVGYIQDGVITLNKDIKEEPRKSYVSKASLKAKGKKVPIVIIKQGKQFIAFPIKMVKVSTPKGEELQQIFNSDVLSDAQKVVAINNLLAENKISPRKFDLLNITQTDKLQAIEQALNEVESFKTADDLAGKNYEINNLQNDAEISLDLENLGVYLPSQKLSISLDDVNLKDFVTPEKTKKKTAPKAIATNARVTSKTKEKVEIRIENEAVLEQANKSKKLKALNLKVGDNVVIVDKDEADKLKKYTTTSKQTISKVTVKSNPGSKPKITVAPKETFTPLEIDEDNVEEVVKVDESLAEARAKEIANIVFKSGAEVLEGELLEDYKKDAGYINKLARDMEKAPQKTIEVTPKKQEVVVSGISNLSIDYSEYEVGAITSLYKKEDGNWYFKDSRGQEQKESAKNRVYLDWLVEEIGQGATVTNQEFKDKREDFKQAQEQIKTENEIKCS